MSPASLDWYPESFSALDRLRIEQALVQTAPTHPRESGPGALRFIEFRYPSDPDAIHAVLQVFAVVVQILHAQGPHGSASGIDRCAVADRVLADLIARVHPYRWHPTHLETFMAAVRQAVDEAPWWRAFVTATRPAKSRDRDAERARRQTAREAVVLPLLDDADWTPTQWALESGVDPSVALDYLAGTSMPRKVSRQRLTDTLMKALHRSPLQLPE